MKNLIYPIILRFISSTSSGVLLYRHGCLFMQSGEIFVGCLTYSLRWLLWFLITFGFPTPAQIPQPAAFPDLPC